MDDYKSPREIKQEQFAFIQWLRAANDAPDQNRNYSLKLLGRALKEELTETQRLYMLAYYADGLSQGEIGALYGVNDATVSRVIRNGKRKIQNVLKYSNPVFLREALGSVPEIPPKHNWSSSARGKTLLTITIEADGPINQDILAIVLKHHGRVLSVQEVVPQEIERRKKKGVVANDP